MKKNKIVTAERVSEREPSDNYVFQRSILAYLEASKIVSGTVLEIGTGNGYGIQLISEQAKVFITADKNGVANYKTLPQNVYCIQMTVPILYGIPDNSVDYVISFQLIEHIDNDKELISEMYRVLKPGGKLLISTPNKQMTIARNPYHVREYTMEEFEQLIRISFDHVEKYGVFGNQSIQKYYQQNKESVKRLSRLDIFNLWDKLPRQILQLPFDILNRWNRQKLHSVWTNPAFTVEDYFLVNATKECFDLFYIARKI